MSVEGNTTTCEQCGASLLWGQNVVPIWRVVRTGEVELTAYAHLYHLDNYEVKA